MSGGALSVVRRRVLGLLLVAVLAAGVTLSIALYDKAFTPTVEVKLEAGDIGNQLTPQSDVKVRGLIVGSVKSVAATEKGAELTLALDPESAKMIPAAFRPGSCRRRCSVSASFPWRFLRGLRRRPHCGRVTSSRRTARPTRSSWGRRSTISCPFSRPCNRKSYPPPSPRSPPRCTAVATSSAGRCPSSAPMSGISTRTCRSCGRTCRSWPSSRTT